MIGECVIKHMMTLLIKAMSVLKVTTYIITSILFSFYQTRCDTSSNVSLDLQKCQYSKYIGRYVKIYVVLCMIIHPSEVHTTI